jgi:hypothetical protein
MAKRRALSLSIVLAVVALGLVGSGFADFNAQTTNTNAFSSGTLVLSNAKTSGTTCLSTGGSNTNTNTNAVGCDNLINATGRKPGDPATTSVVTIRNVGSIAATVLQVFTTTTTGCASTDASGETYHGTGDLCTAVALTIHDDTNNRCYYPTQAAGACAMDATRTLSHFLATWNTATPLSLSTTGLSSGIAFTVAAQINSTAGNSMQGRTATIDLNWKMTQ